MASGILTALMGLIGGGASALIKHEMNVNNQAYNHPAAQMQRFKEAGINPYSQAVNGNVSNTFSQDTDYDLSFVPRSVQQGFEVAVQNKQLHSMDLDNQRMEQVIEGLKLDNQFKSGTLSDRTILLYQKTRLQELDIQVKHGIINQKEYENEVARLNTEVQKYLSGQPSIYSGMSPDPDGYIGIPAVDLKVAELGEAKASAGKENADLDFLLKTKEDRIKAENYKSWKLYYEQDYLGRTQDERVFMTESQAQYWSMRAIREEIAKEYEKLANMPWDNKDWQSHIIMGSISKISRAAQKSYNKKGKFSWNLFFQNLGKEFVSN